MSTTSAPARPRLKERYLTEVRDSLKEGLGLGNVMEVPRLEKIVINMGVGRATQQGGVIDKFMPVHVSTVAVVCKACDKPSRVGYRFEDDGEKVRVCKKCGTDL